MSRIGSKGEQLELRKTGRANARRLIKTTGVALCLLSGTAHASGLSPADRKLKQLLVGAATSCEAPVVVFGTSNTTLGGARGACDTPGIERLVLRNRAVFVQLATDAERDRFEGLACRDIYKYVAPGAAATYNITELGPNTLRTSTVCITPGALREVSPSPSRRRDRRSILRDSDSQRVGNGQEFIRNFNNE